VLFWIFGIGKPKSKDRYWISVLLLCEPNWCTSIFIL